MSEEVRQRMIGRVLSDEHIASMSKARKGVPWTPARRAAQEARKQSVQ